MRKKKIIWRIAGVAVLVLAGVGFYFYKEFYRTHKDTAKIKPAYTVQATALISEFEKNEAASNSKYWDKVLKVEGMVKELIKDEAGFYSVVLGDTSSLSSVRLSMDSVHNQEAAGLKRGETIAMKGICSGFNPDEMLGSDVILVRSVLDKNK
ncbi:MAG: hypothetical protein IPP93_00945 [Chitinophagaceae bacterium]|nr:hypothetical protein [Chitinophagaceae bacterium]MBL0336232.1 hypothetical protein [Chitinophagaceae bacterium]